ncbi:hypothetical protein C8T65DRAFT_645894 [Cerioporus squamosus]|nr:hypothetical protein C8T65DRAFT_645894 [Cerioporus squamosus]
MPGSFPSRASSDGSSETAAPMLTKLGGPPSGRSALRSDLVRPPPGAEVGSRATANVERPLCSPIHVHERSNTYVATHTSSTGRCRCVCRTSPMSGDVSRAIKARRLVASRKDAGASTGPLPATLAPGCALPSSYASREPPCALHPSRRGHSTSPAQRRRRRWGRIPVCTTSFYLVRSAQC